MSIAPDGILIVDGVDHIAVINNEAGRLLGLPPNIEGRQVDELEPDPEVARVLGFRHRLGAEVMPVGGRLLAVEWRLSAPGCLGERPAGTLHPGGEGLRVATLRDVTDTHTLSCRLDVALGLVAELRAQLHEAANRLHTVVTLVQLERYVQAVDLAFAAAGSVVVQREAERVVLAIDEPVLSALLVSKLAEARDRGVDLRITEDTRYEAFDIDPVDLVTLVGNLVDNAMDAVLGTGHAVGEPAASRQVDLTIRADATGLLIRVADSGPGLDPDTVADAFGAGWTTKPARAVGALRRGLGLALVRQIVTRHGGQVHVGRERGAVFTVSLAAPGGAPAPPGG
ncbi:ATP-binding protein [Frankia sp. CcI49]|uniref:sensor histidine kinase n=1 Tax=Frankia sp. CcI49 TaxID=1745382 RepID=UPI0013041321|nr:ATP-binding protein [Frankia sp. CcI49]